MSFLEVETAMDWNGGLTDDPPGRYNPATRELISFKAIGGRAIVKPIYAPKGAAKEYGDYAINIYTGCPHRCFYCFAPSVLHRDREAFHSHVAPRKDIVEETKRQLEREKITGKLIHLCFTCDPYPVGYDTRQTREIIKALKAAGNHVQILTKGDGTRDFDLLDSGDWYGVTITGHGSKAEPNAADNHVRLAAIQKAKDMGINTWVSCEPVIEIGGIYQLIICGYSIDKFKIGKLNYHPSGIDWKAFGKEAERLCIAHGRNYYIKESLRKEMKG